MLLPSRNHLSTLSAPSLGCVRMQYSLIRHFPCRSSIWVKRLYRAVANAMIRCSVGMSCCADGIPKCPVLVLPRYRKLIRLLSCMTQGAVWCAFYIFLSTYMTCNFVVDYTRLHTCYPYSQGEAIYCARHESRQCIAYACTAQWRGWQTHTRSLQSETRHHPPPCPLSTPSHRS